MITKVVQITILVKDLDEAKTFYVEKLGFSVCADQVFSSDWRYLTIAPQKDNATVFELVKAETPEQEKLIGNQSAGQVLVMFESDNIQKDFEIMKEKGVVLHGEPIPVPGGKGVGFEDLYGNQFDLYQSD
ncbi:VOC family protein [Sphingobacterium sp. UT-1RO-CII-1]|uniref:VOC family protein n=1 Tax=Sphingobacterium sp. UT-1RO-CII-1 TaxID=2995225 RepID=UPI00227C009B|nr:VOC family protein [Sphingobacterium sp. UT-1RO-CII-1]MCY4780586.1 VOC family protein [Sphingobacterium sp. UT-1RO-CII-1]